MFFGAQVGQVAVRQGRGTVSPALSMHVSLTPQACTLARRNADVFLKYLHRNSVNMPGMVTHIKAPEQQVKSECRRAPGRGPGAPLAVGASGSWVTRHTVSTLLTG